jgi:hypothetical protein
VRPCFRNNQLSTRTVSLERALVFFAFIGGDPFDQSDWSEGWTGEPGYHRCKVYDHIRQTHIKSVLYELCWYMSTQACRFLAENNARMVVCPCNDQKFQFIVSSIDSVVLYSTVFPARYFIAVWSSIQLWALTKPFVASLNNQKSIVESSLNSYWRIKNTR